MKKNELTPKQARFVQEYLIDLNATQAAIRAGYSEKTANAAGSRLLLNVDIQAEIQKGCNRREKRTEVKQDRVVRELAKVAFSELTNIAKIEEVSPGVIDLKVAPTCDWPAAEKAALSEISAIPGNGVDRFKLKMHPKLKALELLGRHLGMFTDRVEVKGSLTFADLWDLAKGKSGGDTE